MKAVIHGFGTYLPRFRLKSEEISSHWKRGPEMASALGIKEKTVCAPDEDAFTMAWEAARKALANANVDAKEIGAVYVGSESHPYAVKPTSGMVASAMNVDPFCMAADLEFACKAGTAAMQIVGSLAESDQIKFGLAIGSDKAQGKPGDALEYSAAAGAAAFVIGKKTAKHPGLCSIDATLSYTTDTPDFWRNAGDDYPQHAGRFTGEPGYFHHIEAATKAILEQEKKDIDAITHVVFHMPNAKFPVQAAQKLGITKEQLSAGFIVPTIGNTYSACSLLGLASVLQQAKKDDTILLVSYGSGAGADAFLLTMLRDGTVNTPDTRETVFLAYGEYVAS